MLKFKFDWNSVESLNCTRDQTRWIIWMIGVLRRTVVCDISTTFAVAIFRFAQIVTKNSPITQMIFFNQGMLLLGSNYFLLNNQQITKICKQSHGNVGRWCHLLDDISPQCTLGLPLQTSRFVMYSFATLLEVTQEEIKQFSRKPLSKSCELDPLPTVVLKGCLTALPLTITRIISLSLWTWVMPNALKVTIVLPMLEKKIWCRLWTIRKLSSYLELKVP